MKAVVAMLVILSLATGLAWAQSETSSVGRVSQIAVPIMTITDAKLIKLLMDEFFIPETLVTRMEIIDVGKNGFGPKDLVKTHPSDEIYFLEFVSQQAQQLMNDWKFQANFQIIAQNIDPNVINHYSENKPAYNIFISLLKSLGRNYQDFPMKIKLERDSSTVKFEMWDYNEHQLRFDPRPIPNPFDDLIRAANSYIDSTYYDCIFIYKTIVDTVYIYRPGLEAVAK